MEDCLFCKIVNKEIPASIFYEDADTIAFLDIAPANLGHTLVVPKKHCKNILDCPEDTMIAVAKTARRLASRIMEAAQANGLNLVVSNEATAGQEVFHMHWHLIPRYDNDGLLSWPKNGDITTEQNEALLAKFRAMN